MLERKAKLKVALFCFAIALLLSVVMMSGCGTEYGEDVVVCRVYPSQTLQIGDDPDMARIKNTSLYVHKCRLSPNEIDEYNSVRITDNVLGIGNQPPVIEDMFDGSHWTTWTDWYTVCTISVSKDLVPSGRMILAGYWSPDKPLPQTLEYRDYDKTPVVRVDSADTSVVIELLDWGYDTSWDNKHMRKWVDLRVTLK